jgi:hypothetical protein
MASSSSALSGRHIYLRRELRQIVDAGEGQKAVEQYVLRQELAA